MINKYLEHFMKKTNQAEFKVGKIIQKKGDKLYMK